MIKQWKLEKASTERVGIIRSYNPRYLTQGRCLEESVFFLFECDLISRTEPATIRTQSPGGMNNRDQLETCSVTA